MLRWVIFHPEEGIYLGNCMGFGFFSLLDSVGQEQAVVFISNRQAKDHIRAWDTDNNPDNYKFIQLECDNDLYATIEELKEGGLAEYLGDMEENRRKNLQDG